MKNETIKTYTEITPLDGLKLLVENEGKPVEGLAFTNASFSKQKTRSLSGISVDTKTVFVFEVDGNMKWMKRCATITEIDPCKAPYCCPELEPWMAYIGTEPEEICGNPKAAGWPHWIKWSDEDRWDYGVDGSYRGKHHAVDVRTAWAQENYPEHCRIRNYQEPDPFEEAFVKVLGKEAISLMTKQQLEMTAIPMRQMYKLGQANPSKEEK